ncbi:hypothetical protein ACFCV4_11310 [Enterococcus faecium]|uniref:hypothetical protein n=1 Tax=Enterococcus faecium TaxID=1352 RepID=UPI0035E1971A
MENCSLCNTGQKQSTVYDSQGRIVSIVDRNLVFVENYREYAGGMLQTQQSTLPISFCPMCGRALEQEEE